MNDGLPVYIVNTDWCGIVVGAVLVGFFTGVTVVLGVLLTRSVEDGKTQRQLLHQWYVRLNEFAEVLERKPHQNQAEKVENPHPTDYQILEKVRLMFHESRLEDVPNEPTPAWLIATSFEREMDLLDLEDSVPLSEATAYKDADKAYSAAKAAHKACPDEDVERSSELGKIAQKRSREWIEALNAYAMASAESEAQKREKLHLSAQMLGTQALQWLTGRWSLNPYHPSRREQRAMRREIRKTSHRIASDRQDQYGK